MGSGRFRFPVGVNTAAEYICEMWVGACGSGYLLTVRFTELVASLSYTLIKRKKWELPVRNSDTRQGM